MHVTVVALSPRIQELIHDPHNTLFDIVKILSIPFLRRVCILCESAECQKLYPISSNDFNTLTQCLLPLFKIDL